MTADTRIIVDFRTATPDWRLDPFEYGAESLHADPVLGSDDRYVVNNVPFFTHEVCYRDVVECGTHPDRDPNSRHWDGRVVKRIVSGEDCVRVTAVPDTEDMDEARDMLIWLSQQVNARWPDDPHTEGGMGLLTIQLPIEHADSLEEFLVSDGRFGFILSTRTFD